MTPDWFIYAGENEGNPLLVSLDRAYGKVGADKSRPWAVMVEIALPRLDANALPPQSDWPALEAIEAALVKDLATDEDDWRYVVRTYGEGVARFGFYARRTSAAPQRVARVLAEFEGWNEHRTQVQSDPQWSAYKSFFPDDEKDPGFAPSFRDETPYPPAASSPGRPPRYRREEQPFRGEEFQKHPDE